MANCLLGMSMAKIASKLLFCYRNTNEGQNEQQHWRPAKQNQGYVQGRGDKEFHTGTVQSKDRQTGNQNHDIPYACNAGNSLFQNRKSVCLY